MYAVYSVPSGNNEQQATLKVAPLSAQDLYLAWDTVPPEQQPRH